MNKKVNEYQEALDMLNACADDYYYEQAQKYKQTLQKLVDLYTQANKSAPKSQVDKIVQRYNSIQGLPRVVKLTDSRRRTLNARIKDYGIDMIYEMLELVSESDFLRGNTTQWSANFDWIMNPNNFVKILEGNYKNKVEVTKGFVDRDDII